MKTHAPRLLLIALLGTTWLHAENIVKTEKRIAGLLGELRQSPADYAVLMRLGRDYAAIGKSDNAEACYAKAIRAEPDAVEPYHALALLYLANARYADARKACAVWRKKDPQSYYAALCLADAYSLDGDLKSSAATLEELRRRYPSDLTVLNALKLRRDWLGQKDESAKLSEAIATVTRLAAKV